MRATGGLKNPVPVKSETVVENSAGLAWVFMMICGRKQRREANDGVINGDCPPNSK